MTMPTMTPAPEMLIDQDVLADVREQWRSVRSTQALLVVKLNSGVIFAPWLNDLASPLFALLLPFGFASLETLLKQAHREMTVSAKSNRLGDLMTGAKGSLPWQDFAAVDRGREVRNSYAHHQAIPPHADSVAALDAIEREFVAWSVLEGPVKYAYTFQLSGGAI